MILQYTVRRCFINSIYTERKKKRIFWISNRRIYIEKKKAIGPSPMTKSPIPTQIRKPKDNTQTPPKTSITQRLRTDLGRSVTVTSQNINFLNIRNLYPFIPTHEFLNNVSVIFVDDVFYLPWRHCHVQVCTDYTWTKPKFENKSLSKVMNRWIIFRI